MDSSEEDGISSPREEASSTSSSLVWEYDVFLSFRGPDTRNDFVDCLYVDLMEAQIRTFRDSEELHVGEEIGSSLMEAIDRSNIFMPIFSKGYASSKWCLKELSYVLKHRHEKQVILPVFYDMDPYDVKHQSGSYKKAFRQHRKIGIRNKVIHEWKRALRIAGEKKGLVKENDANGSQGKLKNLVLDKVSKLLQKPDVIVPENLVGVDHQVNEVLKLLRTETDGVRFVGIWGMGGVGKTTLAKVIYKNISTEFDSLSFLSNVREWCAIAPGVVALQKQLISEILKGKSPNFSTEDKGIMAIRNACHSKKVLIILDDVDEKDQIYKLAGGVEWFGPGSRVIVTTRDQEVLNLSQPLLIYEVKELDLDSSLQLLCKHAFNSDHPWENEAIAKDIVSITGGLPLALEVVGSYLHEKGHSVWMDTFEMLRQTPDDKVRKAFEISFHKLSCLEKQTFLDIACLFIGFDKDLVSYMWRSCELVPGHHIRVLVNMSLVKIDEKNKFQMHDQLRCFGRTIVNEENPTIPGRRSRIWSHEEARDVLNDKMGTESLEALYPNLPHLIESDEVPSFTAEAFATLSNLRCLRLGGAHLSGDFRGLLQNLRWLSWAVYDPEIVPVNLSLKNLVILDLSHSSIMENWGGWSWLKHTPNLKVLDLSYCVELRRTPKFHKKASLEKLHLKGCLNLSEIDPSIRYLESLVLLDLTLCHRLELRGELGSLRSLVELLLDGTEIRRIPGDVSKLQKLKNLSLGRLPSPSVSRNSPEPPSKRLRPIPKRGQIKVRPIINIITGIRSLFTCIRQPCMNT